MLNWPPRGGGSALCSAVARRGRARASGAVMAGSAAHPSTWPQAEWPVSTYWREIVRRPILRRGPDPVLFGHELAVGHVGEDHRGDGLAAAEVPVGVPGHLPRVDGAGRGARGVPGGVAGDAVVPDRQHHDCSPAPLPRAAGLALPIRRFVFPCRAAGWAAPPRCCRSMRTRRARPGRRFAASGSTRCSPRPDGTRSSRWSRSPSATPTSPMPTVPGGIDPVPNARSGNPRSVYRRVP